MPNVLLMSSDLYFMRRISTTASNAEFVITNAVTSDKALIALRDNQYDSVIVNFDGAVIDTDDLDLIRQIRKLTTTVIVVIVNDDLHNTSVTRCYAAGADDVIRACMKPEELVGRIQTLLRRREQGPADVFAAGDLELNTTAHTISIKSNIVPLTGKEYSLMEHLVLNKGLVVSIDTFSNRLYPDQGGSVPDYAHRMLVETHIQRARQKLKNAGSTSKIVTMWGRGYMLVESA